MSVYCGVVAGKGGESRGGQGVSLLSTTIKLVYMSLGLLAVTFPTLIRCTS